jgi:hypothetical protein
MIRHPGTMIGWQRAGLVSLRSMIRWQRAEREHPRALIVWQRYVQGSHRNKYAADPVNAKKGIMPALKTKSKIIAW